MGLVVYTDKNRRRDGRGKGLCERGMNGFGLKYLLLTLCDMVLGSAMVALREGVASHGCRRGSSGLMSDGGYALQPPSSDDKLSDGTMSSAHSWHGLLWKASFGLGYIGQGLPLTSFPVYKSSHLGGLKQAIIRLIVNVC